MFAAVVAGLRRDVVRMVVILSSSALLVALVPGPAVANPTHPKSWKVWKYGETGGGANRPNSQIGKCQREMKANCKWEWIGGLMSHWAARALEAQLIFNYLVKHGTCPPGHNPGRLKVCR